MARPPQPLDAERELRLLTAAATAFTQSGYELASLNQIIADAGWAKSSFYHYFPDKRSLHDHVVLTLRAMSASRLVVPDLGRLTPATYWPAMASLATSFARASAEHPEFQLLKLMLSHPSAARSPDGRLTQLRSDVAQWMGAVLVRGRLIGEVRKDLPASLLAEMALALVNVLDRWTLATPTLAGSQPALTIQVLQETFGSRPSREVAAPR